MEPCGGHSVHGWMQPVAVNLSDVQRGPEFSYGDDGEGTMMNLV